MSDEWLTERDKEIRGQIRERNAVTRNIRGRGRSAAEKLEILMAGKRTKEIKRKEPEISVFRLNGDDLDFYVRLKEGVKKASDRVSEHNKDPRYKKTPEYSDYKNLVSQLNGVRRRLREERSHGFYSIVKMSDERWIVVGPFVTVSAANNVSRQKEVPVKWEVKVVMDYNPKEHTNNIQEF